MCTNVRNVLKRLQFAYVRFQLSKSQYQVPKLLFLGHGISADGVPNDPEKVKPVQEARGPTSVSKLR